MVEPSFIHLEGDGHGENGLASLDCDNPPGGEALAVANAVHFVKDGNVGVACAQKIAVQTVSASVVSTYRIRS